MFSNSAVHLRLHPEECPRWTTDVSTAKTGRSATAGEVNARCVFLCPELVCVVRWMYVCTSILGFLIWIYTFAALHTAQFSRMGAANRPGPVFFPFRHQQQPTTHGNQQTRPVPTARLRPLSSGQAKGRVVAPRHGRLLGLAAPSPHHQPSLHRSCKSR
jgi:hypothetical protein